MDVATGAFKHNQKYNTVCTVMLPQRTKPQLGSTMGRVDLGYICSSNGDHYRFRIQHSRNLCRVLTQHSKS